MKRLIVILASALTLYACSEGDIPRENHDVGESRTVNVAVGESRTVKVNRNRVFSGTVSSDNTALIIPKVTGYISDIPVEPGTKVNKGQVLARLSNQELTEKRRQAESAVQQAESRFELAEKTYERFKNLLAGGNVSQQEFDKVESDYQAARQGLQQARSALDEARTFVSYTILRAPFDGVVQEKMMDVGNLAAPGNPLMKVGTTEAVITTFMNESLKRTVSIGTEAEVVITAADLVFSSPIVEISPDVDPATRNFKVKLAGHPDIVPGMYAKVSIATGNEEIVLVPKEAIVKRGQLTIVFVNDDGTADMRLVKTGRAFGDDIEILAGISPDEPIVVGNASRLRAGDTLGVE